MYTTFSVTVMLLGGVSNEEYIMLPHLFPQGLIVNAADYKEEVEQVVDPWIATVSNGRPYTYHQNSESSIRRIRPMN